MLQVVKCKTVFAKVCQLGHRDKSEKRTIKVCLRRKVRDCGIEGPEVCSKEKEMGNEILHDVTHICYIYVFLQFAKRLHLIPTTLKAKKINLRQQRIGIKLVRV